MRIAEILRSILKGKTASQAFQQARPSAGAQRSAVSIGAQRSSAAPGAPRLASPPAIPELEQAVFLASLMNVMTTHAGNQPFNIDRAIADTQQRLADLQSSRKEMTAFIARLDDKMQEEQQQLKQIIRRMEAGIDTVSRTLNA